MTVEDLNWLKLKKACVYVLITIFPLPSRGKSIFNNLRSILEFLFSVFIIVYCLLFIFTPYSVSLDACESEYFSERSVRFKCEDVDVKVIDSIFVFSILSLSSNVDMLGINTFFNTIFINEKSANKFNQKVSTILKHELEHTNQRVELGFINFFMAPKWLIEGSADYIRGKPTIGFCAGLASWGNDSSKQFYFESWAKVAYLLQVQDVSYDDLFKKDLHFTESEDVIKAKIAEIYCPAEKI
ncbi:hypothetical protein [Shewanella sp.]